MIPSATKPRAARRAASSCSLDAAPEALANPLLFHDENMAHLAFSAMNCLLGAMVWRIHIHPLSITENTH
ncbi:MAG TPA: hypothetical protein DDW21_09415 [Verrucomicrobiales bacterium]|nr:MAG: hypothetical protein CAK88_02895 [Verrucomicrobiae bacterium AMD-G2]HBE23632.1 hypothetical protein [Verrucomicrobiales bacterium]